MIGLRAGKQNRATAATAGRGHEPTPATTNPQKELFLLCVFVLTEKYEQYRARTNSSGHKIPEVKFVVSVFVLTGKYKHQPSLEANKIKTRLITSFF